MRKTNFLLIALLLLISTTILGSAQAYDEGSVIDPVQESTVKLLSGTLAGLAPVGAARSYSLTALETLPDRDIYLEYGIKSLIEQQYGRYQVQIFLAQYPAQAYGLYSFYRDPFAPATDFGVEGDLDVVEGQVCFWQGQRVIQVRVNTQAKADGSDAVPQMLKLAQTLAEQFNALDIKTYSAEDVAAANQPPAVIRHLPTGSLNLRAARYVLGPRALARLLQRDVSSYTFYPNFGTEVAIASYDQGSESMRLLIIEYHTPQQAGDAFNRLNQYRNSLSTGEQAKMVLNRQGNYVVEATGFQDTAAAQRTVDAVKYDYTVKWLTDPPLYGGRTFESEAAKTAQILVSVFGIIGITALSALIIGVPFGIVRFYLRRRNARNQPDPFTDAGGMVRLNLDEIALPGSHQDRKMLGSGS
ncbi:MAG: DUF6599 family protein [Acidobacteriota bacterium]